MSANFFHTFPWLRSSTILIAVFFVVSLGIAIAFLSVAGMSCWCSCVWISFNGVKFLVVIHVRRRADWSSIFTTLYRYPMNGDFFRLGCEGFFFLLETTHALGAQRAARAR